MHSRRLSIHVVSCTFHSYIAFPPHVYHLVISGLVFSSSSLRCRIFHYRIFLSHIFSDFPLLGTSAEGERQPHPPCSSMQWSTLHYVARRELRHCCFRHALCTSSAASCRRVISLLTSCRGRNYSSVQSRAFFAAGRAHGEGRVTADDTIRTKSTYHYLIYNYSITLNIMRPTVQLAALPTAHRLFVRP